MMTNFCLFILVGEENLAATLLEREGDWPHLSGLSPRFGYHEHEGVRLGGRAGVRWVDNTPEMKG